MTHPQSIKTCSRCGETKPLDAFHRQTAAVDGRHRWCKACLALWNKARHDADPEAARARYRLNYQARRETFLPIARERRREYVQRPGVREQVRAAARARYHSDADYRQWVNHQSRQWALAHPEKRREVTSEWTKRNAKKVNALTQRRRARRRAAGGSYTAAQWLSLCALYGNRCLACGEQRPLTPDHVIPISKGGTSYIDNIQPLCMPCNRRKQTHVIDYRGC